LSLRSKRPPRLPDCARWVYVSLPHATCLLGVDAGGVVVAAPPKARRTSLGRPIARVEEYVRNHRDTATLADV
jgi:hypothetical protein